MGSVKIPYYVVHKGFGYWQPKKSMRALGFASVPCGKDGPEAWARARLAHERWLSYLATDERKPALPPSGSLGEAFRRYRETAEWSVKKAARTREEWERCWRRIEPVFGDVKPSTVTLEHISAFRQIIATTVSQREAHRCIKIWRALWQVAAALKFCAKDADPSFGVRNTEPTPRSAAWSEGEVVRLVKAAWRSRYYGLAALISTGWDTQLSPVDLRGLTTSQSIQDAQGLAFVLARAKTGRAAYGTISRRTERIVNAYIAQLGAELLANAPIFRNRSGRAYSKDTLGDDFRDVRAIVFGDNEKRTLADFRRSGAIEAIRGGAEVEALSAKMANDLDTSRSLHKTYAPVDLSTVRQVDAARRQGRRKG